MKMIGTPRTTWVNVGPLSPRRRLGGAPGDREGPVRGTVDVSVICHRSFAVSLLPGAGQHLVPGSSQRHVPIRVIGTDAQTVTTWSVSQPQRPAQAIRLTPSTTHVQ